MAAAAAARVRLLRWGGVWELVRGEEGVRLCGDDGGWVGGFYEMVVSVSLGNFEF